MEISTSQKLRTGIFTIAGIAILVIAIFVIGSNRNMFGRNFNIYGTFKNIGGLRIGNNVLFAGIKVGTVENISFVSDTVVRVDMVMKADVRPYLKKDAIATIGSSGLMGDKNVTILPGSVQQTALLKDGDRIGSMDPVGMDEMLAKFTSIAGNAEVITTEIAHMAMQVRQGNGTLSRLLYNNELSKSLEGSSKNAEQITASLAGIAHKINKGQGSIGQLVNTDTFSHHLYKVMLTTDSTISTVREAAAGFSENMKAMQSNFLFRGYFKRKAKEEAAAKKNDSLKTSLMIDTTELDLDEAELEELIMEAQKALDAKRKKNKN